MIEYADTQARIVIWSLVGTVFLLFIALLSCFCSNIKRNGYEQISPDGMVNSRRKNFHESFRQFKDYIINIDEVHIGQQLGRGSFGTVYKGKFRGSWVAVKRMEMPLHMKEGSETFVTEVDTLSKLRNRNIVQLIGVCIDNETPCIMMEYMKGGSIAKVIHKDMRHLKPNVILKWALDAAIGMEFLHSHTPQPIIHRDLKSDNLLVDENNVVKVADFGTAKLFGKITKVKPRLSRRKRRRPETEEDFPGTAAWAAPEVLPPKPPKKAGKYSTAADVYSFGITVWEMVTNERPFKGYDYEFQMMDDIMSGARPHIPQSCPNGIAQVLQECWRQDAARRPTFSIVHEWLDRLQTRVNIDEIIQSHGRRGSSLPIKLRCSVNAVDIV